MEEKLVTTTELCDWLRISGATASRWRAQGMPHYGKTRAYRYKKSEVMEWLKEQESKEK